MATLNYQRVYQTHLQQKSNYLYYTQYKWYTIYSSTMDPMANGYIPLISSNGTHI